MLTLSRHFLQKLRAKGISIGIHCNSLSWSDPQGVLTTAEEDLLREQQDSPAVDLLSSQTRGNRERAAPLTFQQERLLSLFGNPFGGPVGLLSIHGHLDYAALNKSLQHLVNRHDTLRAQIVLRDDGFCQQVNTSRNGLFAIQSVARNSDSLKEREEVDRHIEFLAREWLLEAKTTYAVKLLKLSTAEHILIVLWDHSFFDYRSITLLFRELWSTYAGEASESDSNVAKRPTQYFEYAMWQRDQHRKLGAMQNEYWSNRLQGIVPIRVPPDRVTSTTWHSPRDVFNHTFDLTLTLWLTEVASRLQISKSFVAITLLVIALSIRSSQRRFSFIMTSSGRYCTEHLGTIGLFSNLVRVRIDCDSHNTLDSACKAVSHEFLSSIPLLLNGNDFSAGDVGVLIQWFPEEYRKWILPFGANCGKGRSAVSLDLHKLSLPSLVAGTCSKIPLNFTFMDCDKTIQMETDYDPRYYRLNRVRSLSRDVLCIAKLAATTPTLSMNSILQTIGRQVSSHES